MDEVAQLFRQAALDGSWETALQGLAGLCGGNAAELIGVGAAGETPFHRAYNIDFANLPEFIERGGWDPQRNARVRMGLAAPLLQPITEAHSGDLDAVLDTELYADYFSRQDILFNAQTTLMRGRSGVVGLAVCHTRSHGLASAAELDALGWIAPHVQDAVRLQLALEGHGAQVLSGSLDILGAAAFICTADGQVRRMTAAAEALARSGAHLGVVHGRLGAAHPQDKARFEAALGRAGRERMWNPRSTQLLLRSRLDGSVLVCEIAPLPLKDFPMGLAGAVLVIARPPRSGAPSSEALQGAFGLTPAECQVALAIAGGLSPADVARQRGASTGTVRSQLKSVAAKLGVSRQAEIAALIASLRG